MPAGTPLLLTINSNVSEPERLFTTISQLNSVMPSNLLVSFKPPIYPDTLPDQFFVTHLDFVPSKHNSVSGVVGICKNTPLTKHRFVGKYAWHSLSHKIKKTNAERSSRLCSVFDRSSKLISPHKPTLLGTHLPVPLVVNH